MSKLITINSKYRDHGSNSSFHISMPVNDQRLERVTAVGLVSCNIPHREYNIQAKLNNNTLQYNLNGGGVVSYDFKDGFYTTSTIIQTLNNLLSGVTITQDNITGRLVATTDGSTTLELYSASSIASSIGLYNDIILAVSSTEEFSNLPSLNGLDNIYIVSDKLAASNSYSSNKSLSHVLAVVPVNTSFGGTVVFYDNSGLENSKIIYDPTHPISLTSIDFRIEDGFGNLLSLEHEHVHLTLRVYFG